MNIRGLIFLIFSMLKSNMLQVVFMLIICCSGNSQAYTLPGSDQIPFHHLSVEDGLSQVTVNDITQDENSFLWFATEDGLNRFDGKRFLLYRTDADEEYKISGNIINFVFNDSRNRLWVGTNGQGVDVKTDNQFFSIPITINGQTKTDIIATVIFEDENNTIWLGSWGDGLFKYSEKQHQFLNVDSESKYKKIWTIASFHKKLFIGSNKNGVLIVEDESISAWGKAEVLATKSIKILYTYHNTLLIGTDGSGLWEFNTDKNLVKNVALNDTPETIVVHKIYADQNDTVWIGTLGSGIFRLPKSKNWVQQTVGNEPESLSNNRIFSIFQDKSGVLWLGTEGAGLNYYDPYSIIFRNIRQGSDNSINLNDRMVYAITSDDNGDWWIGTESGGVNHWDNNKQQFHYYTVETGHLLHDTVRALYKTGEMIFVGTMKGFSILTRQGKLIQKWDKNNLPQLPHNIILSFEKAGKETVWIGTYTGLILFNYVTQEVEQVFLENSFNGPFEHGIILTLLQINNMLWVGTLSDGLYSFDKQTREWEHVLQGKKENPVNNYQAISSLFVSKDEQIWVSTLGSGLIKFNPILSKIVHVNKQQGIANNVIYGILADIENNIWMSTNAGLSSYNLETRLVKNYSLEDGIQGREFNVGAYHHRNHILAFGGIKGISWFDERKNQTNPFFPETKITNIRVLNKNIRDIPNNEILINKQKGLPRGLILDHNKTMFTIEFAALHFSSPKHNSFKYRLLGLDDKWISSINMQSEATYTGLAPGQYQFEVFAISKDGLADVSPATLEITLLPPFWKTWWAYSIYVLLSIIFIWRYQVFLKRKLEFQKDLNEGLVKINDLKERLAETERMAILGELSSNVAHSLRNPLASIRTSAELLEDDSTLPQFAKDDAKNIISEVDRLSTWIKELLAYSKTQSSNMEPLDIVASCKEMVDSYQTRFQQNQIHCIFEANVKSTKIAIDSILFQHMLHSLIDNAIEAIEGSGNILLSISKVDSNSIKLTIWDDGCGINFSKQAHIFNDSFSTKSKGLGMGLSLVKRIVERHDATIEVTSEEKLGTKFTITFSLYQE